MIVRKVVAAMLEIRNGVWKIEIGKVLGVVFVMVEGKVEVVAGMV